MRKIKKKLLPTLLALTLSVTYVTSDLYAAETSEIADNLATEAVEDIRTNLHFLQGTPGDTDLVYTYKQGGETYKVIEKSTADFKNVHSTIYVLEQNGNFVASSKQKFLTNADGSAEIIIEDVNGSIESRAVETSGALSTDLKLQIERSNYDWVTEYANGNTAIDNLTISVIIATITTVATLLCSPVAGVVVSGVSSIATAIFNANAEHVYYYKIYNWRHSDRNYFVIEETEWTKFYLDSGHNYSLGASYYEGLDN